MSRDDVDGNLASLRAYESAQAKQDEAWEECKAEIKEVLDEIEDLACQISELREEALKSADWGIYDFSEEIAQEIKEVM